MNKQLRENDLWTTQEADFPVSGSDAARARFLLRYATLAPSTRNSQPWRFTIRGARIDIAADLDRWSSVSDADRRELEISLGCALENLIVAADQFGYFCSVELATNDASARVARATLLPAPARRHRARPSGLFSAIVDRRTHHGALAPRPLDAVHQKALEHLELEPDVRVSYNASAEARQFFDELTHDATVEAFRNPAFRRELADQIGTGAFGSGPFASRVGRLAVARFDRGPAVARRESRRIAEAATIGVITTTADTRGARIRAGQVFERLWLLATTLGIVLQPMSQVLEDPADRARVGAMVRSSEPVWPQQVFRLGYPIKAARRHTPRRPLATVISGSRP